MARLGASRWIGLAVVACLAVSAICATADGDDMWDVEYSVDEYAPYDFAESEVMSSSRVAAPAAAPEATYDYSYDRAFDRDSTSDAEYSYSAAPVRDWSKGLEDQGQIEPYFVEEPFYNRDVYRVEDEYEPEPQYDVNYYEPMAQAPVAGSFDSLYGNGYYGPSKPYDPSEVVSSNDMGAYSSYGSFSRSPMQLLSGLERVLQMHMDILRAAAPGFVAPLRPDSPALIQARTNALQQMACGRRACMPQVGVTQVQTLAIVVDGNSVSATATATQYVTLYDNEYRNYDVDTSSSGGMRDVGRYEYSDAGRYEYSNAGRYEHSDAGRYEYSDAGQYEFYDFEQAQSPTYDYPLPFDGFFSKYVSSGEFIIQWACMVGLVVFTICFWVRNFLLQRNKAATVLVLSEATPQSPKMTNPLLASQPEYITITTETLPLLPSGKQAPREYNPPEMV